MKSDIRIQHDVLAELHWDPSINATGIGVQVAQGIVTLTGQVASLIEKWDVERAALQVNGVKALAVEITVVLPSESRRGDTDIIRSAENALAWSSYLADVSIKVMAEAGFMTLTGKVDWEYQRQAAADCLRSLRGVTGISNQIAVRSSISIDAVKADIDAALLRGAVHDSQQVTVTAHGGEVTLSGTVPSWSDRYRARHAAWSTAGVCNVLDQLVVAG